MTNSETHNTDVYVNPSNDSDVTFGLQQRHRTYHKWSESDDVRLLETVRSTYSDFLSIGVTVQRQAYWVAVRDSMLLNATPEACAHRYRVLTSQADWAERQREKQGLSDRLQQMTSTLASRVEARKRGRPKLSAQTEAAILAMTAAEPVEAISTDDIVIELQKMKQVMTQLLEVWK